MEIQEDRDKKDCTEADVEEAALSWRLDTNYFCKIAKLLNRKKSDHISEEKARDEENFTTELCDDLKA